jgi:hypothetical protein
MPYSAQIAIWRSSTNLLDDRFLPERQMRAGLRSRAQMNDYKGSDIGAAISRATGHAEALAEARSELDADRPQPIMPIGRDRRWCLFTSAGDRSNIRVWLKDKAPREWDLVAAYYGDNDQTFSEIRRICTYAFRTTGSKFQNLKKLVSENPKFFDQYSLVWVCDDDILMSAIQINEAFELTETFGFWVAQPGLLPGGRNSHWITCCTGRQWDYRIVNFVEVMMPIFRRDKLMEFLAVYDGTLTGWGIEWWYANFLQADKFGRFAILDKVKVFNPRPEMKGGSEIDRLRPASLREADWKKVQQRYRLVEYQPKVFAYCKLPAQWETLQIFLPIDETLPTNSRLYERLWSSGWRRVARFARCGSIGAIFLRKVLDRGWNEATWFIRCGLTIRRQVRNVRFSNAHRTAC